MTIVVLLQLLTVIFAAFIGGVVFKKLKQPPVIGYIIAGFLLSIFSPDQSASETVNFLSELGIVLLLLTLGLEFSLKRLGKVAKVAIVGGIAQILVTIGLGTLLLQLFHVDLFAAVFMAAAFSLSSTAIVVKLLTDRGEMETLSGEILVGWLVIQDLAVLPMMILLPTLGRELTQSAFDAFTLFYISINLVEAVGILAIVLLLGRHAIPWMMERVARLNSRELLLVSAFVLAIAAALFTQFLGLSAALGAFLAGLLIAETAQNHAVFAEIRPLRDLFALLFFATLGLLLPAHFILQHWLLIISVTVVIVLLKFLLVVLLTFVFGYHSKTSFIVGIGLVEVGEFAFILAKMGLSENLITTDIYGLILAVALLSILIMPPLYIATPTLYKRLRELSKKRLPVLYAAFFARLEHNQILEELPFANHVVLCGYGRVGKYIGRALEMATVPYIVIDFNQRTVRELREKGTPVVYGDPADIDILDYAQVDKAKVVIIAIPDLHTQKLIVINSLKLNKEVEIFCRTHHEAHQKELKALGVQKVIQPEFEAAVSIAEKILKSMGHAVDDIEGKISRLKIEHGLG